LGLYDPNASPFKKALDRARQEKVDIETDFGNIAKMGGGPSVTLGLDTLQRAPRPKPTEEIVSERPVSKIAEEMSGDGKKLGFDPWMALAAAGFGMAGSTSPFPLQAAAQGGQAGLASIAGQKKGALEARKVVAAEKQADTAAAKLKAPTKKIQNVGALFKEYKAQKMSTTDAMNKAISMVFKEDRGLAADIAGRVAASVAPLMAMGMEPTQEKFTAIVTMALESVKSAKTPGSASKGTLTPKDGRLKFEP
jgi:hypothetical protein